jgi:hypothetical protein
MPEVVPVFQDFLSEPNFFLHTISSANLVVLDVTTLKIFTDYSKSWSHCSIYSTSYHLLTLSLTHSLQKLYLKPSLRVPAACIPIWSNSFTCHYRNQRRAIQFVFTMSKIYTAKTPNEKILTFIHERLKTMKFTFPIFAQPMLLWDMPLNKLKYACGKHSISLVMIVRGRWLLRVWINLLPSTSG